MENRSFTLIELLVVIAIVGLLTSIVLVSTSGVRERARIAKGLDFSHSIQHVLGAYAAGWWSFETIEPGDQVIDGSGYGYDCTVHGADLVAGLEQLGNALQFNGTSDYLDCGTANVFNGGSFALEAWFQTAASGSYQVIISKARAAPLRYENFLRVRNTNEVEVFVYHTGGAAHANAVSVKTYNDGNWHHAVGVWEAGVSLKLFVDGQLVATDTSFVGTQSTHTDGKILIGWIDGEPNYQFNGLIDEVRIYEQALSITEIQQHYSAGLVKHKNLVIK